MKLKSITLKSDCYALKFIDSNDRIVSISLTAMLPKQQDVWSAIDNKINEKDNIMRPENEKKSFFELLGIAYNEKKATYSFSGTQREHDLSSFGKTTKQVIGSPGGEMLFDKTESLQSIQYKQAEQELINLVDLLFNSFELQVDFNLTEPEVQVLRSYVQNELFERTVTA